MSYFENSELDMDKAPEDNVEVEIIYDEVFYRTINDGDMRPWSEMRVLVGDTYVVGDDEAGVTGWAGLIVDALLRTIEAVLNDETADIEFQFGPYFLGIHPRDSTSVFIGGYHSAVSIEDPTTKLEIDRRLPATKRAWIKAVINIANEFHNTVIETNADLYNHRQMEWIRNGIHEGQKLARERGLFD